jgi:Ethanolamine utilization protein EutJ (predicted chaperonin)
VGPTSLVISGAFGISYEQTEELKKDPTQQERLFPASARKRSQIASMHETVEELGLVRADVGDYLPGA